MRHLRLLIIALAGIFVLALAVSALVNKPEPPLGADDDIIIKGGSLELQCGKNHKTDNSGCLRLDDKETGRFRHKQDKDITRIIVKDSNNAILFDSGNPNVNLGDKPEVVITYEAAKTTSTP